MSRPEQTESVSRSAWLALKEEQQLVRDGYEFLDEKRILLAAEMLVQRQAFADVRARFDELSEVARDTLVAAVADVGLDGLQVYPAAELENFKLVVQQRPSVGQVMLAARVDAGAREATRTPVRAAKSVLACAAAHRKLMVVAAELAAIGANIRRLTREYRRTERRVRALENVVLPEIREDLAMMEEHLDTAEQEEVIRVRCVPETKTPAGRATPGRDL